MTNRIIIETLTPVHIGSGRDLSKGTEFLHFYENEEDLFAVIDEQKVLNIIGEENIDKWVSIIQKNKDLKEYLLQRKPDLVSKDIAKRIMPVFAKNYTNSQTIKEQMHNGQGIPYIPGSSLKGAIRTSIFTEEILSKKELAARNLKGKKGFSAENIEKRLFGNNPNEDIFRFLQVGDAYFKYETIALKSEIFNKHFDKWKFKPGGSQLIEAIPNGAASGFQLKINNDLMKKNHHKKIEAFDSTEKLLGTINMHSKRLLKDEIQHMNDVVSHENAHTLYREWLNDVLNTAESCSENEAVMRVGYGSGWKFITGGWARDPEIMSDPVYDKFLHSVRNQKKYDASVPFPKSRNLGDEGDMFGFVKLKMGE
jgi:CRISPR type III-A-associated RAMP protein Csm5